MSRYETLAATTLLVLAIGSSAACRGEATATAPAGSSASDARQFWAAYHAASRHRSAGQLDQAVVAYAQALQLRPNHEDSLYYLGNCYLEQGAFDRAQEAYRRLIAVNPQGSSRGYMQLALTHASPAPGAPFDLAEARRLFQRALDVDPDSGALLGLGEVALLEGDWAAAAAALRRAGDDNQMSVAVPYLLGYLAFRRGDRAAAWKEFTTAVERVVLKKPAVKWTEEGDVKADPALRWRALARQSVLGDHWLRVREYAKGPGPAAADMAREYRALDAALRALIRPRRASVS
jgi:tetratricopeptide (TPR) repeat protein